MLLEVPKRPFWLSPACKGDPYNTYVLYFTRGTCERVMSNSCRHNRFCTPFCICRRVLWLEITTYNPSTSVNHLAKTRFSDNVAVSQNLEKLLITGPLELVHCLKIFQVNNRTNLSFNWSLIHNISLLWGVISETACGGVASLLPSLANREMSRASRARMPLLLISQGTPDNIVTPDDKTFFAISKCTFLYYTNYGILQRCTKRWTCCAK